MFFKKDKFKIIMSKLEKLENQLSNISESQQDKTLLVDGTKRVIKSGNKQKIKTASCDCGCIFQFVSIKDEIYGDQNHPIKKANRYTRCPECDSLIKTRDYEKELEEIKELNKKK